jgi:DNA-binding MurR/RpiR family transcriptional regulator
MSSKKFQDIASYIVKNAHEVQFQTITNLAQNTASSEATVIRFCRYFGFKGYPDFRMSLAIDLNNIESVRSSSYKRDAIDLSAKSAASSLLDTSKIIDREALKRICLLIHESDFINCLGIGASSVVANYLNFRLLRIGKRVMLFEDTHVAAMKAVRCDEKDLWFVLSSSGSTTEVLHVVKAASLRGAQVVALSNIAYSPLARLANELLVAARPEGPLTGGSFVSKVSALLVVDALVNSLLEMYPTYSEFVIDTAEVVLPFMSN